MVVLERDAEHERVEQVPGDARLHARAAPLHDADEPRSRGASTPREHGAAEADSSQSAGSVGTRSPSAHLPPMISRARSSTTTDAKRAGRREDLASVSIFHHTSAVHSVSGRGRERARVDRGRARPRPGVPQSSPRVQSRPGPIQDVREADLERVLRRIHEHHVGQEELVQSATKLKNRSARRPASRAEPRHAGTPAAPRSRPGGPRRGGRGERGRVDRCRRETRRTERRRTAGSPRASVRSDDRIQLEEDRQHERVRRDDHGDDRQPEDDPASRGPPVREAVPRGDRREQGQRRRCDAYRSQFSSQRRNMPPPNESS